MNIAIVYSLPTARAKATPFKATDEDTRDSARQVASALRKKYQQVTLVPVSEDTIGAIAKIRADCIVNLIEWDGLDMALSLAAYAQLEASHIPFTGSRLATLVAFSDKIKMKEALDVAGLPTPRWQLFTTGTEPVRGDFHYPVIVKLAWEHCSVGLTRDAVIERSSALPPLLQERIRVFSQPVYVEEFILGREFQVTVLSRSRGVAVLPPAEITFQEKGNDAFLTYEGRWDEAHKDYALSGVALAKLTSALQQKLTRLGEETFTKLGFADYARLDIRMQGNRVYILEPNFNPGLSDDDDYGMTVSYRAAGMTFADFITEIVASCLRRFGKELLHGEKL